jgi:hypothetical protein
MVNAQLLETENLIRSLADELLKLKSAVQQYEEARADLSKIHESLEKIGASSQSLAENTRAFMSRLEQINIEKRLAELHQDDAMLIEGQARHAQQAELMAQQHMQQSKTLNMTRILVLAALLAQAATILILVLR